MNRVLGSVHQNAGRNAISVVGTSQYHGNLLLADVGIAMCVQDGINLSGNMSNIQITNFRCFTPGRDGINASNNLSMRIGGGIVDSAVRSALYVTHSQNLQVSQWNGISCGANTIYMQDVQEIQLSDIRSSSSGADGVVIDANILDCYFIRLAGLYAQIAATRPTLPARA